MEVLLGVVQMVWVYVAVVVCAVSGVGLAYLAAQRILARMDAAPAQSATESTKHWAPYPPLPEVLPEEEPVVAEVEKELFVSQDPKSIDPKRITQADIDYALAILQHAVTNAAALNKEVAQLSKNGIVFDGKKNFASE